MRFALVFCVSLLLCSSRMIPPLELRTEGAVTCDICKAFALLLGTFLCLELLHCCSFDCVEQKLGLTRTSLRMRCFIKPACCAPKYCPTSPNQCAMVSSSSVTAKWCTQSPRSWTASCPMFVSLSVPVSLLCSFQKNPWLSEECHHVELYAEAKRRRSISCK
jgi:hypothetical protein